MHYTLTKCKCCGLILWPWLLSEVCSRMRWWIVHALQCSLMHYNTLKYIAYLPTYLLTFEVWIYCIIRIFHVSFRELLLSRRRITCQYVCVGWRSPELVQRLNQGTFTVPNKSNLCGLANWNICLIYTTVSTLYSYYGHCYLYTDKSNVGKVYLRGQYWKRVPKGQRLVKDTLGSKV